MSYPNPNPNPLGSGVSRYALLARPPYLQDTALSGDRNIVNSGAALTTAPPTAHLNLTVPSRVTATSPRGRSRIHLVYRTPIRRWFSKHDRHQFLALLRRRECQQLAAGSFI